MSGPALAVIVTAAMLTAILARVPIAAAMFLAGFGGTWAVLGSPAAVLAQLKTLTFDTFASYSLSIVPLFLLMGQIAARSGLSGALFAAAAAFVGHRRGGMALAAIGASAGFGAVCGSSLATAATMGQVALPEMRRRGYSDALATGTLAAGGTLGILIPPSIVLVLYAILTEQNIVRMFAAALIPGLIAAAGYMAVVAIYVRVRPAAARTAPRREWRARWRSLARVWPVVALFALVMGGMIGDWNWVRPGPQALFTPTEGAAVGALAILAYCLAAGQIGLRGVVGAIEETAVTTGFIFLILLGAQLFNTFLAYTRAPQALAEWAAGSGLPALAILAALLLSYLVLGCVMDSLSMILLTVPVYFPIVTGLDLGLGPEQTAIWFGILALITVEVGLITPPVGMNLFIINRLAGNVPIARTYAGAAPFVLSDLLRVAAIVAFPGLALWLAGGA